MNSFKRATTVILRQPGKSALLLLLIFLLGTVLSGVISISRAMAVTEQRLLMKIPAVATIVYVPGVSTDPWQQPTREEVTAIGNLPYVWAYDFTIQSNVRSNGLVHPAIENRGIAFSTVGRGVYNPEITDMTTGVISLIEGRVFTQAEIDNDERVVVIPQNVAQMNHLTIGSTIELENIVGNPFAQGEEDAILAEQILEVEVIGIFGRDDIEDVRGDSDFFYMPVGLAEDMHRFMTETQIAFDEERFRMLGQGEFQEEPIFNAIFVLNSPRDLETFQTTATTLLADGWTVIGIDESVFAPIISSMDMVLQIVSSVQWGAVVATMVVLTLVILLFLRDRRHEIGIYMALGDKKRNVVIQILTEIGIITAVAIILALFTGRIVSDTISNQMFEQHLIEQTEQENSVDNLIHWELGFYMPRELTVEEALELYDVTLDTITVVTFTSVSIVVILVSATLPIWYAVKLEPKELLL